MPYQPTQNYYYQPTSQPRQTLVGLKGRPVTGLEEVRAATTPKEITQYIYAMSAKGAVL